MLLLIIIFLPHSKAVIMTIIMVLLFNNNGYYVDHNCNYTNTRSDFIDCNATYALYHILSL
jgi:hypothetical protein